LDVINALCQEGYLSEIIKHGRDLTKILVENRNSDLVVIVTAFYELQSFSCVNLETRAGR
jgi:hypothetical protein